MILCTVPFDARIRTFIKMEVLNNQMNFKKSLFGEIYRQRQRARNFGQMTVDFASRMIFYNGFSIIRLRIN